MTFQSKSKTRGKKLDKRGEGAYTDNKQNAGGMKMNRTPFTAAYFYFGYYRFGNGSVCCETTRGAK